MTFKQALTGMMQLFSVFSFFFLGVVCVCLPFTLPLRLQLVHCILEKPEVLTGIGIGLFCLTFLLTLGFYGLSKGRFLLMRMGDRSSEVNVKVLRKSLSPLFRSVFAAKIRLADVEVFKNDRIHFSLALGAMEGKEREAILHEVNRQLETVLSERFGYRRPFTVQLISSSEGRRKTAPPPTTSRIIPPIWRFFAISV